MTDRDPVIVARFHYRSEGEVALGYLQEAEIPAALFADDAGGAEVGLSFVNPARLMVPAVFEDEARSLLMDAGILEEEPDGEGDEKGVEPV